MTNTAGRYVHYENNIHDQAVKVWHNAASGMALASFTFDDLMRKRQATFGSGVVNTYTYSGDRVSKWEVKPVGATAITNNFTYDNHGYLSSTGEWARQKNNSQGSLKIWPKLTASAIVAQSAQFAFPEKMTCFFHALVTNPQAGRIKVV